MLSRYQLLRVVYPVHVNAGYMHFIVLLSTNFNLHELYVQEFIEEFKIN